LVDLKTRQADNRSQILTAIWRFGQKWKVFIISSWQAIQF